MTPLELQLLRRLALPEHPALLAGARQHRPGPFIRSGRDHVLRGRELRRILKGVQAAGAEVKQGYVHTLILARMPSGLNAELEDWLSEKVLPTRAANYEACGVSINQASRGRTCVVVLMATLD